MYKYKIKVFNKQNPCVCIRTVYAHTKKEMQQYVAYQVDHTIEEYWSKKLVK